MVKGRTVLPDRTCLRNTVSCTLSWSTSSTTTPLGRRPHLGDNTATAKPRIRYGLPYPLDTTLSMVWR